MDDFSLIKVRLLFMLRSVDRIRTSFSSRRGLLFAPLQCVTSTLQGLEGGGGEEGGGYAQLGCLPAFLAIFTIQYCVASADLNRMLILVYLCIDLFLHVRCWAVAVSAK